MSIFVDRVLTPENIIYPTVLTQILYFLFFANKKLQGTEARTPYGQGFKEEFMSWGFYLPAHIFHKGGNLYLLICIGWKYALVMIINIILYKGNSIWINIVRLMGLLPFGHYILPIVYVVIAERYIEYLIQTAR